MLMDARVAVASRAGIVVIGTLSGGTVGCRVNNGMLSKSDACPDLDSRSDHAAKALSDSYKLPSPRHLHLSLSHFSDLSSLTTMVRGTGEYLIRRVYTKTSIDCLPQANSSRNAVVVVTSGIQGHQQKICTL